MVSYNGYHMGLEVEYLDQVFDNVRPEGFMRASWLDDIRLSNLSMNGVRHPSVAGVGPNWGKVVEGDRF